MINFHDALFKLIESTDPNKLLDVGYGEGYTVEEINNHFPEI